MSDNLPVNIPVLFARGRTLAEAYEKALIELHKNGIRFKTQYDKPGDPQSMDATMNITVDQPMCDPMIHKAFPGGIEDLREYVYELEGIKDTWVKNINDSKDTRWEYTYHQRLADYGSLFKKRIQGHRAKESAIVYGNMVDGFDQFRSVVEKLCKQPFTRQAQMITWMPHLDNDCYDPPCLQRIWFRIIEDSQGVWNLNYNVSFRSNDAWGAYMMNSFGITMMVKELIADEIAKRTGKKVVLGRMNWQADSWHVYGKDIPAFEARLLSRLETTTFEDRVFNFNDPDIQDIYKESEHIILEKIKVQQAKMDAQDKPNDFGIKDTEMIKEVKVLSEDSHHLSIEVPPWTACQISEDGSFQVVSFSEKAGEKNTVLFEKKFESRGPAIYITNKTDLSNWVGLDALIPFVETVVNPTILVDDAIKLGMVEAITLKKLPKFERCQIRGLDALHKDIGYQDKSLRDKGFGFVIRAYRQKDVCIPCDDPLRDGGARIGVVVYSETATVAFGSKS